MKRIVRLITRYNQTEKMEAWERGECIAHITPSIAKNASPGPGKYNTRPKFKKQCPPIKMKGRHVIEQEPIKAPYYNIPSSLGKVPKVSMHTRSEEKGKFVPPGPTYMPPKFGADAHKIGIAPPRQRPDKNRKCKGEDGKMTPLGRRNPDATPGPGPGTFNTRWHEFDGNGRAGTAISGHHDFKYDKTASPGPARYKPKYEKILPSSPKIRFHNRPPAKDPPVTAGYRNIGSTLGGYKYSMKARANDDINII